MQQSIILLKIMGEGCQDFYFSLRLWRLWTLLAWLEIRQRYVRSVLGPLWLTISMAVMIGTLGFVYSYLFKQKINVYLPNVASGIVVWGFFATTISEGCGSLIVSGNFIKQINQPLSIYMLQTIWRNVVIFLHNFIIIVISMLVFGINDVVAAPWFILGLIIFLLNQAWIVAVLSIVSARFRDFPQIIAALLQVLFYITPIIFTEKMLPEDKRWIIMANPVASIVCIVQKPLIGLYPEWYNWERSIIIAIFGWLIAFYFIGKYKSKVPFWV